MHIAMWRVLLYVHSGISLVLVVPLALLTTSVVAGGPSRLTPASQDKCEVLALSKSMSGSCLAAQAEALLSLGHSLSRRQSTIPAASAAVEVLAERPSSDASSGAREVADELPAFLPAGFTPSGDVHIETPTSAAVVAPEAPSPPAVAPEVVSPPGASPATWRNDAFGSMMRAWAWMKMHLSAADLFGFLRILWEDFTWTLATLMPDFDWANNYRRAYVASLSVFFAVLWFVVYYCFFYKDDRDDSLRRWISRSHQDLHIQDYGEDSGAPLDIGKGVDSTQLLGVSAPDMVILFQHPNAEDGQRGMELVTLTQFEHVLDSSAPRHLFPRLERERARLAEDEERAVQDSRTPRQVTRMARRVSEVVLHRFEGCKCSSARVMLLRDLYGCLPALGFDVSSFASTTGEHLLVCTGLRDPEVVNQYLVCEDVHLRLHHQVVAKLGIKQPPGEPASSPPLCRYDPQIIRRMYMAGVLDTEVATELYAHHGGSLLPGGSTSGSPLKHLERYRLLTKELTRFVNLDIAKSLGLIEDYYFTHDRRQLGLLRQTWANWKRLADPTFVQPARLLRDYFGSRLAFLFSWNGFYCKALLALSPIAVAYEIIMEGWTHASAENDGNQLLGFAFIIVIWAQVAHNKWLQEEEFLVRSWDAEPDDEVVRPTFRGKMMPSLIDQNVKDKQYPAIWTTIWSVFANCITVMFCIWVCFCLFFWRSFFGASPKTGLAKSASSLFLTVQIQVFESMYNHTVERLVELENHKTIDDYYRSYVRKQFIFQSMNAYSPFFYLTMKQSMSEEGCGDQDCLVQLRQYMAMSFTMLSVCRTMHVGIAAMKVRRRLNKWRASKAWHSFTEEQSQYVDFEIRDEIEGMMQLVIALGYVLLFAVSSPIVIPLCLGTFIVHLNSSAYLLTHCSKRPFPWKSVGIGVWNEIISQLFMGGVLNTAFLLVAFGDSFRGTPLLTRLSGVLLFCISAAFVSGAVKAVCPPSDSAVKLLLARRRAVERAVMVANTRARAQGRKGTVAGDASSEGCPTPQISTPPSPRGTPRGVTSESSTRLEGGIGHEGMPISGVQVQYGEAVAAAEWDKIPRFGQHRDEM